MFQSEHSSGFLVRACPPGFLAGALLPPRPVARRRVDVSESTGPSPKLDFAQFSVAMFLFSSYPARQMMTLMRQERLVSVVS